MSEIPKSYEPRDVEKRWYAAWLEAGCFKGRAEPGREHYSIVIPPPNVTGVLTMGHVLNNTLQDILIRRARLEGKSAVWVPDDVARRWGSSCRSSRSKRGASGAS
jgi:valyl-tRNA synthetase